MISKKINIAILAAFVLIGFHKIQKMQKLRNRKNLKDQVVVITGAARGIGREMALKLSKLGCKLALIGLHQEGVEKVAKEINDNGGIARAYQCDVGEVDRVYQVRDEVINDFGRCDILINNAGIVSGEKFLQESNKKTELILRTNTLGPMFMSKAFLPGMLKNKQGHIVTISSNGGRVGINGLVSYCASKFGAIGMDESLRGELKEICPEVKTTCVCPAFIDTGMFSGAKPRSTLPFLDPILNLLMPVLNPDDVASSIIEAIQESNPMLILPPSAKISDFVRAFCPIWLQDEIFAASGTSKSMETFEQTRIHD